MNRALQLKTCPLRLTSLAQVPLPPSKRVRGEAIWWQGGGGAVKVWPHTPDDLIATRPS